MSLFTYSACEECFYRLNIFLNTGDELDDRASLSESRVDAQQVVTGGRGESGAASLHV